ncbi:MFS transporter [Herbidospora daliensis]|uniref:MFS transporter n=1 Tax=Herbidospora daliensis TaxID=295585 RepID=UPI000783CA65|nr:MFS transporter [Herbidospora daliensis]
MLTVDRRFGWVWAAYAVSAYGTWLGFGAFPLIAVLVLDVGPAQVSALSAAGLAVGAVAAVPLGPWVEFRAKRQVMVAMDLIRFAALVSVPVAYGLGWLSFGQLVVVSVVAAAAKIAFNAAAGAYLKGLLSPQELLVANGRLESTMWSASVVGPPLGGAAIGLFGPVVTVLADAVSYLVSALCVRAIGGGEPSRERRSRPGGLLDGWREIWAHRALRRLFCTTVLFNGLLLATEPLLAILLLDRLGFTPWQYGLVFALPCLGLAGARLARPLAARFGQGRVLRVAGVLRTCWPVWLAFVQPGVPGIVLVIVVQSGLVFCCAVFAPVLATYRLERIAPDRVARTLTAWSVTGSLAVAALTAIWGLLAAVIGPREAIVAAGVLILFTGLSGRP